jgi:hypothetical protein
MLSAPLNRHSPRTKYITARSGSSRHRRFPRAADPTTSSISVTGTCSVSTLSRSGNPCSAGEEPTAEADGQTKTDLGGKAADSGIEAPGKDGLIVVDPRPPRASPHSVGARPKPPADADDQRVIPPPTCANTISNRHCRSGALSV